MKKNLSKIEKKIVKTKGEVLRKFVVDRYVYSKDKLRSRHDTWKEYYNDYRGQIISTKYNWQANYIIPVLKEIVRTKTPLYLNILFAAGIDSFEISPREESDEKIAPILKEKLTYDLRNIGRGRGGFFGVMEEFVKQYEIYGYSVGKVSWNKEYDYKGKTIFEGPDFEVIDIFNFFPDPTSLTLNSWKIFKKDDVFISDLRQKEKQGIYFNIKALKGVTQPVNVKTEISNDPDVFKDKVNLLEYHGEVPKSLIEGEVNDESEVDPYEDDYVEAIVTIANEKVVIRAEEYPYDCGNIFVDVAKDRMPNEKFGIGTGEDIQAMAMALTIAYDKFDDCVSLVSIPTVIVNPNKIVLPGDDFIVKPGGIIYANSMVENVQHAVSFLDTTAAASALTAILTHIRMLDERLQKLSNAVPAISPMPTKKELPQTLGATQIMQANASEPIKHAVTHQLEPAFISVLVMFYKLDLQFFKEESAYRILGEKLGEIWGEENKNRKITKQDIKLSGEPDFIAKGVSVFSEKNIEIDKLQKFLELGIKAVAPSTDAMGQTQLDGEGKPVMKPLISLEAIIKRIGEALAFKKLDELIPSLAEEKDKQRGKKLQPPTGTPTPVNTPQIGGNVSPSFPPAGVR
jgi:hypothetical protein